jgi:hypothetical protein
MKNTDYTLDFPAPDESYKDVFNMVWFEAGRRYKLYWNSDAAAWRIVRRKAIFGRPLKSTHRSGGLFKASVATKARAKRRLRNCMG